jgi:hypothetical protein
MPLLLIWLKDPPLHLMNWLCLSSGKNMDLLRCTHLMKLISFYHKNTVFWVEESKKPSGGKLGSFILPPAYAGFLLGLQFDLDDGGDIFLQNVGISPTITTRSLYHYLESKILHILKAADKLY